jgi:hypothetical protein
MDLNALALGFGGRMAEAVAQLSQLAAKTSDFLAGMAREGA